MQGLAIKFAIKEYERRYGVKHVQSVEECYGKPVDEHEFRDKIQKVNFAPDLKSNLMCLWEKRHSLSRETQFYLVAAVFYFVCPVDALPEAVLGPLGYSDDIAVLTKCVEIAFRDLYWS